MSCVRVQVGEQALETVGIVGGHLWSINYP